MHDRHFHVVVVGAGPAGAAAAALLARAGKCVLLTDRMAIPPRRPAEVLAPSAARMLRDLGMHDAAEGAGAIERPAFGIRSLWGGQEFIDDFLSRSEGQGYFVDRAKFDLALRNYAYSCGAQVSWGLTVRKTVQTGDRWDVEFSGESMMTRVEAAMLVDATGRAATVARRIGASRMTSDRLVARAHPASDISLPHWLQIEARPDGWCYETAEGAVHVCDSTSSTEAASGRAFDASSAALDRAAGKGWIAVGDAACSFDPISGQGLAQAISSGRAGAAAILAECDGQRDAMTAYVRAVHKTWLRTELMRYDVYASEGRWPDAPFWRRRANAWASFGNLKERLQRA